MLLHMLSREFQLHIRDVLRPLAEKWAGGVKLDFDNAYGIRRYLKGSWLAAHTDVRGQLSGGDLIILKEKLKIFFFQLDTKVISAIINVGQDDNGHPWPLDILDHDGNVYKIVISPGDLVWYESAT